MSSTAPHQAIYRRWRAQTFGQIVGQQPVVDTLRNAVRVGRTAHAYLFVGPRGTGKTSLARILAKALNCTDLQDAEPCDRCASCVAIREGRALDVSEMDAASNNRVDDIRELLPRIYTAPSDLRTKVFIVDEVQRINQGWDVLLKTLEEPPDHVAFIFCTTDSSQIRPAVLSRVQRFDFRRLTVPEIAGKLAAILRADGREAEPEAVDLIARLAAGGMRDAESMLDQLLSSQAGQITAAGVRDVLGLVEEELVDGFIAALVGGQALTGIEILDQLEERGRDLRAFMDQATERLRLALVASLGATTSRQSPDRVIATAGPGTLAAAARRLTSIDPSHLGPGGLRLQLELALLAPGEAVPAERSPELAGSARPDGRAGAPARPDGRAGAPARPAGVARTPASVSEPPQAARQPAPPATRAQADVPARSQEPSAPAVAKASRASGAAAAAGEVSLQQLLDRWPEIVAVVSRHPPTKPLVEACRPITVEGGVVTLGFPEAQAFLRDVAERRRQVLEDGVSRVLGVPVSVRCVATNVEVAPPPDDPDGTRLLAEFRRIYGDDVVDVGEVR